MSLCYNLIKYSFLENMQENVSSAYVNNVAIGEFRPLWYLTFEIPLYELNMTAYVELPIFCYEYM